MKLRLAVAAGGVIGAGVRLGALEAAGDGRVWLWVVVGVLNVAGCAAVGAALAAADRWSWSMTARSAAVVGVCGGLTTFSTVAVEIALALDDGAGPAAAAVGWALLSLGLGVVAVVAGRAVVLR